MHLGLLKEVLQNLHVAQLSQSSRHLGLDLVPQFMEILSKLGQALIHIIVCISFK